MENDNIVCIGMDTHKESTDVSYALDGRENQAVQALSFHEWRVMLEKGNP